MSVERKPLNYTQMVLFGLARGAGTFPLEHVLDRLKIESQLHTEKSTGQSIKDLWKVSGFKGLYSGSSANFIRRTVRESYHWPILLSINRLWKKVIPEKMNQGYLATNIATGHSMAFVQAGITLPFERLLIEKTAKQGYRPFFEKMKAERRLIVYEGFQATLVRHSIVWDLFFSLNHAGTRIVKKLDPDGAHPVCSYIGKSLFISTFVVGLGYPVEFLRNKILMEPQILSEGTFRTIKTLFHRYKWVNLYSGAQVMFIHNALQTLVIQVIFERINKA